jgi:DNA-binding NtrC family response regulator
MKNSLFHLTMKEFERQYISGELERNGWNRTQTARGLGLSYRALLYKIERLQLVPPAEEFAETA